MYQTACFVVPPDKPQEVAHFWAYANLTAKSFKRVTPGVRNILLTTADARVPSRLGFDAIHRLDRGERIGKGLMVDEIQGWLSFTRSELFDRPTVLIDPDLLLQADPLPVFTCEFGIGLTWREPTADPASGKPFKVGAAQPINAGVLFLSPERKDAVISYFARCLDDVLSLPEDYWRWYGDQESLLRVSGVKSLQDFAAPVIHSGDTRLRFFHCRDFNRSPEIDAAGNPVLTFFPDACIVHFKGLTKRIMFEYAERFLGMRFERNRKWPGGVRILS
jgi:hypothetical protein